MKLFVIPAVFLLLTAAALAEGLNPVSPAQGATSDPASGFVFSVASRAKIDTCSLIIDNETVKRIPYNDAIFNKVITYTVPVEDGQHTWQVQCGSDEGQLSTPVHMVNIQNPEDYGVKVSGSGMFRGSMLRAFKFANSPTQQPVEVTKVAAGDVIQIQLSVPPSTIKKELYVKQKSSKDGKMFVWLEDLKGGDQYLLYKGENVSINVTTSHVLLSYKGDEASKATIVAYPSVEAGSGLPSAGTAGNETAAPAEQPAEQPNETTPEAKPSEQPAQQKQNATEQPAAEPNPAQQPQAEPQKQEEPKQGFFKRVLSWFSNVFG